jgi:hypothetical protein
MDLSKKRSCTRVTIVKDTCMITKVENTGKPVAALLLLLLLLLPPSLLSSASFASLADACESTGGGEA